MSDCPLIREIGLNLNILNYSTHIVCVGFLTVNETTKEPPQDKNDINLPQNLVFEAVIYINVKYFCDSHHLVVLRR